MDAVLLHVNGFVGVAAENAVGAVLRREVSAPDATFGDMRSQRVFTRSINRATDCPSIHLLQTQIKRSAPSAEPHAAYLEAIELVTVNRDMSQPTVLPRVVLINANSHQVRHDVGEAVIVIALDHTTSMLRLGFESLRI